MGLVVLQVISIKNQCESKQIKLAANQS